MRCSSDDYGYEVTDYLLAWTRVMRASSANSAGIQSDFLSGCGEMGTRIREFDWSSTPLGPVSSWPNSLRTTVSVCLLSRFPMVIWWGRDLTMIYNDAWRPVLGASKHPRALGSPGREIWPEIWDIIGAQLRSVLDTREATWSDDMLLLVDRNYYTEEAYFTYSYSPILLDDNSVGGVFTAVTETTERVIGARRLNTLRLLGVHAADSQSVCDAWRHCAAVLRENAKDIPFSLLYAIDADGRTARLVEQVGLPENDDAAPKIVSVTESAAGAWPLAAVADRAEVQIVEDVVARFGELEAGQWPAPPRQAVVLPLREAGQAQLAGIAVFGVSPYRALDDDYLSFLSLASGHIATAVSNAQAYESERRRAEALADINRAKTAFFSNVSHEFRTPLTLMLGPLESLLATGALASADREQLATAHRNSLRLLKLVNSLLDFSRIEAGRIKAAFTPTDLAGLTMDLASNFRSAMETAGLTLIVDCPALSQPVYVDRDMWEKIVLNLLSNAFKFTLEGSVTVNLREEDGSAVLSVADTGTGIPESELPHLFERFHRVENARGRTYEGTGIGLALIQELVKLHGGTVRAESSLGQGSTFRVTVPLGSAHLPPQLVRIDAEIATGVRAEAFAGEALTWVTHEPLHGAEEPDNPAAPQNDAEPKSRAKVLLADDNADLREHISRLLRPHFDVECVPDGTAALAVVRRSSPDLILSDIMMPSLDGFGLLAALRGDPQTLNIPVILLSARAGEEARSEGMHAGADDYLIKPFSARELISRVGAHVRLARARQAAEQKAQGILESITDAFVALDRDWRFIYVNSEAERLGGFRREEILGKSHWDVYPEAIGTIVDRELRRAVKEGVAVEFENHYAPWDRWFHVRAYPSSEGGLSVFYQDITNRKRAEQERDALIEMERAARQEAEILNEISTRLAGELDLQRLVQDVTEAATTLTGARFGAFFYNVLNERGETYMLYTLAGAPREAFEKIGMPRNTPVFHPTFSGTAVVRSADILQDPSYGKMSPHFGMPVGHLPVRSYLAVPVKSRSGEVLGGLFFGHPETGVFDEKSERVAVGIAGHAAIAIDNARLFQQAERELRQRRETEESLRDSEERFRQLAEVGPQFIWIMDGSGKLEYVNRRWTEYSGLAFSETADAESIARSIHQEDRAEVFRRWDQSRSTGELYEIEARLRGKEGGFRWFVIRSVPFKDESGKIVKWFGASTDIEEQKKVQEELRRANQDLEQFAYSATHDLQEPLRGVKIYSDLLTARYGSKLDGQALEFLGYLRSSSTRMEMLVRDLLAYSQAGRMEAPAEPGDAGEALKEALSNLDSAIKDARAEVTSDELPHVPVHRTHVQQLFQNLVSNAIKYRSPNRPPIIHISANRHGPQWVFCVSDNGIGIAPEYREKVFGLFKRLHTSDEYSGTGIGLAICQRIVERYQGRIWVESEPGRGSNFFFTLPVMSENS